MAKMKVIVADDTYANLLLMQARLEDMDCEAAIAANGKEVFDILESSGEVDLIFMDIEMPVMNGIEATRKLKSDDKYKHIPVIGLTAHNLEDFISEYGDAGFDNILEKPCPDSEITEVLDQFRK
ncbi:MAG: response regulator [Bacteroidales bacterium]|nr:response regulator [Bacteroidales bacterium]